MAESFPVELLQKYIVIRLLRRDDPAGARRYKEQSLALARPLAAGLGRR